MRSLLSESQIQKLGLILNDEDNLKGSEYYATSICQYSDILFDIEYEKNQINCNCKTINEAEINLICKERSMLIRTGFLTNMRVLQKEGINSHITLGRVIRVLRRLLKGVDNISISCIVHKEMIQGFSLLFRILPDFNSLKVIQDILKPYLFWCYMESELEYIIKNSRILLCITTWMKELNNKDINDEDNIDQKYGLTKSSQQILNDIMIDFKTSKEQYLKEYELISTDLTDKYNNTFYDLEKRTLKDLQLLTLLIKYAGVYNHTNNKNVKGLLNNNFIKIRKDNNCLITTVIIPQVLDILTQTRALLLELIYYLLDEFINIEFLNKNDYSEYNCILKLINLIFIFNYGNDHQKEALFKNKSINKPFLNMLNYILNISNISKEIFSNILEHSPKTGIVVYSVLIQEYIKSLFSIECFSYPNLKLKNKQEIQQIIKNYHSSILWVFGIIPIINLKNYGYEIFLTFDSSIDIIRYFKDLFDEIYKIQENIMDNETNKLKIESEYSYTFEENLLINRFINDYLLESLSIYCLSMEVILSFIYTRLTKENDNNYIEEIINKCHLSSINFLYNVVSKDCQIYSSNIGMNRFINLDSFHKKFVLELVLLITKIVVKYYEELNITNYLIFNKIYEIFKCLLFLIGSNNINSELLEIFTNVTTRLNNPDINKNGFKNQLIPNLDRKKNIIAIESNEDSYMEFTDMNIDINETGFEKKNNLNYIDVENKNKKYINDNFDKIEDERNNLKKEFDEKSLIENLDVKVNLTKLDDIESLKLKEVLEEETIEFKKDIKDNRLELDENLKEISVLNSKLEEISGLSKNLEEKSKLNEDLNEKRLELSLEKEEELVNVNILDFKIESSSSDEN